MTNTALQFFPLSVYIESEGAWHYAFFFYESMVTLAAAILLFINAWKNGKKPNGVNTACYFMIYGFTRSIMEPLRDSEFILNGGGIPWSLVMSICMMLAGAGLLVFVLLYNKDKEGVLIGSVNGEAYGITKFIGDTPDEVAYLNNINMMCKVYPENYVEKPEKETSETEEIKTETVEKEEIILEKQEENEAVEYGEEMENPITDNEEGEEE